ncbi:MAG: DHA2 family efflux MFS transporter permease subunit [Candidatus Competibacteraceae bacterium]
MANRPLQGPALILLTLSLALATFMQVLDTSIANVAIPSLSGDLGVSPNQGTWVITSFAVSNAIALPLTGWLAKRFGEVKLFVAATQLFTLASWLCGLSFNLPMLIAFRVLQGAVAGPLIPLSQSLLLANYPKEKQGMALALWSMTVVVAPIFGPILGGWISDNISWPWIFYINLPVGLLSGYLSWQLLKNRETATVRQPIDAVGLGLLIVGVGCLQVLLDKGNELDWFGSSLIATLAAIATIALSIFIVWELTAAHPVVDLSLFAKRNFTVGTIAISLGYMAFFANVVILPLWLQTQMGYTATWAGLATAPIGLLPVIISPLVGRNLQKIDLRLLVSFSFSVFAAVSFWNSEFTTQVGFWQLALPRVVQGLGVATFFIPLTTMLLSGLPANRLASASGLATFLRILAGSFGTSLGITLWDRREALHHAQLTEQITAFNPIAGRTLEQLHELGFQGAAGFAQLVRMITDQAYMLATDDFFWLFGWLFLGLLFLVWFARPPFTTGAGGGGAH